MKIIGVDVGGTFTDVILICSETGQQFVHKVPSTPESQDVAVTRGVTEILSHQGIDSDDVVENPKKIKDVINVTPEDAQGIVVNYDYSFDKYGNVTTNHWKLRLVRRDSDFEWVGAIHENLMSPTNAPIVKTSDFNILHKHAKEDDSSSLRNIKIIEGKGFGFVEMSSQSEAEQAKEALDGTEFMGRSIRVDEARPPRPRERRGYRRY